MKFDVIGLDSPCVDLAVNVRCFPKPNGAERIQNLSWQGGGKVASGMVAAARLGLCCGIMGNVGDDKYGTFCLRDFQDHGIDTEQMCVRKNRTTNFDIVISDEGSMGRSFVFYPGNAECMTEEELNIEYISNSSYFYIGCKSTNKSIASAGAVHRNKISRCRKTLFHRSSFQEATELSKCNDNSANTFLKHDICLMGKLSGIYGSRSITKQCHLRLVGNENICMFEDVLT